MSEYIDLNLRYHGDDNDYGNGIITNELHLFFQEIELAIKIGPGEIWGVKYSIELSKYLFNQYITTQRIKNEITNFIAYNCEHSKLFNWEVNPEILNVENKELIYIVVNIYDNESDKNFLQKFLLGI